MDPCQYEEKKDIAIHLLIFFSPRTLSNVTCMQAGRKKP